MNWDIFNEKIASEEDAIDLIRQKRTAIGLLCPVCGNNDFQFESCDKRWRCKSCGKSIKLTTGTVMFATQLPKLYWLKVIYCFAIKSDTTYTKDIAHIENKQQYLLSDLNLKIRLVVSKYISQNRDMFRDIRYSEITPPTRIKNIEKFRQIYIDELIFKKSIEGCDDWTKFEKLLTICLSYQNEFRHNDYGKGTTPAK